MTSAPPTHKGELDTGDLPPLQYAVMELLAARHRLGEDGWTLPTKVSRTVDQLADLGLVRYKSGTLPYTLLVWLTEKGRTASLAEGYVAPILKGEAAAWDSGQKAGWEECAERHAEGDAASRWWEARTPNPYRTVA